MALIPKLSFCNSNDCTKVQVTDDTGAYDATDNLGGWGAPNVLLANVVSATIKVLKPGGVKDKDEVIIDLQSQIPNSTFQFKILKTQDFIEGTDKLFPDGTYQIDYTVVVSTGSPLSYTYHTELNLVCQTGLCVLDMMSKIAKTGCDCDDTLITDGERAYYIHQTIKSAAECQRPTEVTDLIILLNKLCKSKDNCFTCT